MTQNWADGPGAVDWRYVIFDEFERMLLHGRGINNRPFTRRQMIAWFNAYKAHYKSLYFGTEELRLLKDNIIFKARPTVPD
jgi:hypothetical protein